MRAVLSLLVLVLCAPPAFAADVPPADGIPASVIIPARNESATIATVVRSILASTSTGSQTPSESASSIPSGDCSTSAAVPATWGEAIDVPELNA